MLLLQPSPTCWGSENRGGVWHCVIYLITSWQLRADPFLYRVRNTIKRWKTIISQQTSATKSSTQTRGL